MVQFDFGGLVFGGNVFGWTADKETSFALLDAFVAAGGRAIDTADVYSNWAPGNAGGESETIIGEWLKARGGREKLVIGTKVFMLPARAGLSAANIAAAVEDSLRRLQTDYIDIYYAHRDDETVPQEEYLAAFDALVRAGKVRALGASGFQPARLRSAALVAEREGLTSFAIAQDLWNLVERGIEQEKLLVLEDLEIVELPYYALASGFLTGKYRPGIEVDSARAGKAAAYLDRPDAPALLAALDEIAAAHRVSVSAVSLAWLRAQPVVGAPIASARTPEQLPALLESITLTLAPDEIARLTEITAPSAA